jgi:hypothetical protein
MNLFFSQLPIDLNLMNIASFNYLAFTPNNEPKKLNFVSRILI